jgi:hypothetical protein
VPFVSKTDAWKKTIKPELFSNKGNDAMSALRRSGSKVRLQIAEERSAQPNGRSDPHNPTVDSVIHKETIELVRERLPA